MWHGKGQQQMTPRAANGRMNSGFNAVPAFGAVHGFGGANAAAKRPQTPRPQITQRATAMPVKREADGFIRPGNSQAGPAAKRAKGADGYAIVQNASASLATGEVRFSTAEGAAAALELSGTVLEEHTIGVCIDERSKDRTKVVVSGLPQNLDKELLKAFFSSAGEVAFAGIKNAGGTPCVGQVRFETAEEAQAAMALSGSVIEGHEIAIKVHSGSKDFTKLQIFNLPASMEWQELKDFFTTKAGINPVFADVSSASGGSISAEVRYDDPVHAQAALTDLNGSVLGGGTISIQIDEKSQDGTKLMVNGIPPGIEWQELKDHFGQVGPVAFVQTSDKGKGKGGKGAPFGGKGAGAMMPNMMMNPWMMQMMQYWGAPWMAAGGAMPGGAMPAAQMGGCAAGAGKGRANAMSGGAGMGGGTGEVRFDFPMHAQLAANMLNGSTLGGATISVGLDQSSQDGSKVWISGLPATVQWQELKDHMAQCGQVAFAKIK